MAGTSLSSTLVVLHDLSLIQTNVRPITENPDDDVLPLQLRVIAR